MWNVKPKRLHFRIAPPFWVKPPPGERKKLNEPIRGGQESPSPPITLTHQSVANKTFLVEELTNPLKLPFPRPLLYSIKKIRRFHSGLLRRCVKRVPARACNKVPHSFCIDPWLLWCLVGFRDSGTTAKSGKVSKRGDDQSLSFKGWTNISQANGERQRRGYSRHNLAHKKQ